jgi:hypothetical protein
MLKTGTFSRTQPSDYTHEGSIGNLCNDEIRKRAINIMLEFKPQSDSDLEQKLMRYI